MPLQKKKRNEKEKKQNRQHNKSTPNFTSKLRPHTDQNSQSLHTYRERGREQIEIDNRRD